MKIRVFQAALIAVCSAITVSAQYPAASPAISIDPPDTQAFMADPHGPSLVAYCQCGGLAASTGNLYFTSFAINEFGPSVASFSRTGKYSAPGSERRPRAPRPRVARFP